MDDEKIDNILKKQSEMKRNHITLIILSLISSLIISFLYFKIFLYQNKYIFLLIECFLIITICLITSIFTSKPERTDYLIGIILSIIFGLSISMIIYTNSIYYPLYLYFITLCIYHYTEYFSVLLYHFDIISYKYFLIDQSNQWILCTLISIFETIIETYFFNKYKKILILFIIGLIMTIIGQFFRISALFTGKKNFTHRIKYTKEEEHTLVTNGIYKFSRHPSYFGFYCWEVGIQLMCCNPICFVAFIIILFKFFNHRIIVEEGLLIEFFGYQYLEYKKKVGILIPFIKMNADEEMKHLEKYLSQNRGNIEKK